MQKFAAKPARNAEIEAVYRMADVEFIRVMNQPTLSDISICPRNSILPTIAMSVPSPRWSSDSMLTPFFT